MRIFPRDDEAGAVAIIVAVFTVVLFALAALVVDLGQARDLRRQSQNAADASALAGANVLYPGGTCTTPIGGQPPCLADAVSEVKTYAQKNFDVASGDWTNNAKCTGAGKPSGYYTVPSGSQCIAFDSSATPSKVWVAVPLKTMSTGFGALGGPTTIGIDSRARATLNEMAPQSCGLCFLGSVDAENADFSVTGSSIRVNGDIDAGPNSVWTATNGIIGASGTVNGGQYNPPVTTTPPFTDPLASLALPFSTSGLSNRTDPCNSVALGGGPGIYNGFSLPNSICTLTQPGLYVIKGTWGMKNNTVLAGIGVTLYVKKPGMLDFKNGDVALTAPTSGTYKDLAIIYDRDNTANIELQGNGSTQITGTVYAPASKLDFNGNSCFGFNKGPVVALGVVKANGNKACVKVLNATGASITAPPGEPSLDQ